MNNTKLKRMVGIALLIALIVVLQFVSSLIPPFSGFSISLVLIPIVLGAAMYGPGTGALLGTAFGVIVYINCVTGADAGGFMVFQANPLLCMVVVLGKGLLCGLASGLVYSAFRKMNPYVAMLLAAIVCPVVNTGVFVLSMLLFFIEVLQTWAGGGDIAGYILTILIVANFVPELIINLAMSPASQRIIQIVQHK